MYTFDVEFSVSPTDLLSYLKNEVETNSGMFDGDTFNGTFSGKGIKGEYSVLGNVVSVSIVKKPFIVPMSLVEKEIRRYFPK